MRTRRLCLVVVAVLIGGAFPLTTAQILRAQASPSPNPAASPGFSTPALPTPRGLASLEVRMAHAKSAKVQTGILGLELGATLEQAHARLDKLNDPSQPSKE